MAATPPLEDAQVLISNQLNTLQLATDLLGGGESLRKSVETNYYTFQAGTGHSDSQRRHSSPIFKEEELSEEESPTRDNTSAPSTPESDSSTMLNIEKLERQARFRAQLEDDDLIVIDEANLEETRAQLKKDMEAERQRFTGASNWAPEEERLFELLYMREHLALMPRHWGYDFQGVPFQDHVFQTTERNPPVIFAHSRKTEFQATKGMMNLIDLSSKVRTLLQSGFEAKAPALIEKTLNDFVSWSAVDGDYQKLEIIPNLIAEVVDSDADHVAVIKTRMDALAQLHRDFLRVDRNDHGWQGVKAEVLDQGFLMAGSPPRSAKSRLKRYVHKAKQPMTDVDDADSLFSRMSVRDISPRERAELAARASTSSDESRSAGQKRKRSPTDQMAAPGRRKKTRASPPRTPPSSKQQDGFTRQPPVVWGLFIINSSVFLCTLDAAKEGDDAYVSWHAEIAFTQTRQCVWHALTVALVVCLARDELMTRLDDFDTLPEEPVEDPDL